jgi:hypothetical protein
VSPSENERLTAREIQPVMQKARPRFRACYENALKFAPEAQGRVQVKITIAPTGKVPVASATHTGNLPPQVASCVAAVTRTLEFPKSRESTSVSYPLSFSPN